MTDYLLVRRFCSITIQFNGEYSGVRHSRLVGQVPTSGQFDLTIAIEISIVGLGEDAIFQQYPRRVYHSMRRKKCSRLKGGVQGCVQGVWLEDDPSHFLIALRMNASILCFSTDAFSIEFTIMASSTPKKKQLTRDQHCDIWCLKSSEMTHQQIVLHFQWIFNLVITLRQMSHACTSKTPTSKKQSEWSPLLFSEHVAMLIEFVISSRKASEPHWDCMKLDEGLHWSLLSRGGLHIWSAKTSCKEGLGLNYSWATEGTDR